MDPFQMFFAAIAIFVFVIYIPGAIAVKFTIRRGLLPKRPKRKDPPRAARINFFDMFEFAGPADPEDRLPSSSSISSGDRAGSRAAADRPAAAHRAIGRGRRS
jgi:hypothetical protein